MRDGFEAHLANQLAELDSCEHPPLYQCTDLADALTWRQTIEQCAPAARDEHLRWFARNDLYFLLRYILNPAVNLDNQWYVDRCREVQEEPEAVDIWSRGAGKSLIKTFALTIQKILNDPEIAICIVSFVRPVAKAFLRWIMQELKQNQDLQRLFPDILYARPEVESPKWSEDDGLIVKRHNRRKESTVEARGLLKDQPTSKHYDWGCYDDMYDLKHTTEHMTHQVLEAFDNSLGLWSSGNEPKRFTISGVYLSENDAMQTLIQRRVRPLRERSALAGGCTLFSEESIAEMRRSMSHRNFCLQVKLDLKDASSQRDIGFDLRWIETTVYDAPADTRGMHLYLLVDPGGGGKKPRSRCAMVVLGMSADRRIWLIDGGWGKTSLTSRSAALFSLLRQYKILRVGYERYSLPSDIEHLRERMDAENLRFTLDEVAGPESKESRILRLDPIFQQKRFMLPKKLLRPIWGDEEGRMFDLAERFKTEYLCFPWSGSFDILDATARIFDMPASYPKSWGTTSRARLFGNRAWSIGSWMSR